MTQVIFSGRSFKWINTVIEMLVNRGEIFVVKRDAIVNTGAGTCNGHINIVAGPADSTADPATLKCPHCAVERQGCAVFRVSLMATKPLRDENYRPKENDRCVNQPGEHVPQRRQT